MRLRALLAVVALLSLPALAQQTVTKAGTAASYAQGVQGVVNGVPIPTTITNSISVAGAADTVGANATFNGNAVCATVLLTGQPGAGFGLQAGTLAATLTPSVSEDATPATPGCTGGNYVPSKFIVDVNGNTSTTLVVTNPNAYTHYGIATLAGSRCARVCTTAYTSGSAVGNIIAGVALSPSPAPSADVTDRAGRLLGKVYGSDGNQLATANTGRLQVDVISGGGSNASVSTVGAAVPGSAAYGGFSDGTNLQGARVYDSDSGAGTQYTLGAILRKSASGGSVELGTASDPIRTDPTGTTTQPISAASLPLPAGASTETTLAGIKTGTDKIPASPSTDRTTAAAPFSTRLSDGAAFYDATKTGQLPAALDGSGFLKVHEQGTATVSGTVTSNIGTTNGLALDASVTGLEVAQASTTSGQKGVLTQGAVTTAAPSYTTAQTSPLSLTTAGALRTDSSATTQPVSGTVTTSPPANASTNVAQIAGSATATAATGVQKVGVTGNTGAAMDAAGQNAASPANELLVAGQFNTTPTTITTGNTSPLQLDSGGNLKVNVAAGGASGGTSSSFGAAFPATGTAAGAKVVSGAPTLVAGNMEGITLDTSGNLRVAGSFSAGAPADTTGSGVTLSATNAVAVVALAGQNAASLQLTTSTSPVFTILAECSLDAGTTYGGTVAFVTQAGAVSNTVVNPANTNYALLLPPGCAGATHVRVRANPYTSGSVLAQLRAVAGSPAAPPYAGVVGANSYPSVGVALIAQDSVTATTSRAVTATVNGLVVDGSAVTQPVSGTVTANQGAAVSNTSAWPTRGYLSPNAAATWTSATALDTTASQATTGLGTGVIAIVATAPLSVAVLNFECSTSGSNWFPCEFYRVSGGGSTTPESSFALTGTASVMWQRNVAGLSNFRVRLNPAITGAGNVVINVIGGSEGFAPPAPSTVTANAGTGTFTVSGTVTTTPPANASTNVTQFGSTNVSTGTGAGGAGIPRVTVSNDSTVGLVAGAAIVGKVGIDQTTPGTTNLVSAAENGTWTVGQSGSWTVDISDRAARLLGVVYGSQAQQLKQTATNFNLQSELAVGGTLIDPRSIRLLTSSDVVDVSDRTARVLGHVICDSGCTPGGSFSDNTAFTAGSTAVSIAAGEFNDTPLADVTSGNAASVRITKQRALQVNLRDSSGNEVTSLGSSGQITDGTYGVVKATVLPQGRSADNTTAPQVVTLAPSSSPIPMTLTLQGQPSTTKGAAPTFLSKVQLVDEHGHMANVKGPAQAPSVYDPAQVVTVSPTPAPMCPLTAAISQTTNTVVIPGVPSKTTYICKVFLVSTTAQSLSITEGTGTTCGTLNAALAGSLTVANGVPAAATGGWVEGNGGAVVYTAKKTGDDVCILQSGAGLVAGSLSYTYF